MKIARKYHLHHADTCPPDYWTGHHLAHVMIPVGAGMSMADIKASLRDEIQQAAVMGSDEFAHLLAADWTPADADPADADRAVRRAYAAINRLRPGRKGQRRFFEDVADDAEMYAYFVFVPDGY